MNRHVIVIVTHNRLPLLKVCLEAVLQQTRPFDGVVVVDNASTDGTREYLDRWKKEEWEVRFPHAACSLLHARVNTGGAGGFYGGVAFAMKQKPDWITLIDDDAILRQDYLEQICLAIEEDGGRSHLFSGVPLTDGLRIGHRRRVTGRLIKRERPVPKEEYEKTSFSCDIASFCGLTVSAEAVKAEGLPDRRFFIWYDDTEYCLRLSGFGPVQNCCKAIIDHKVEIKEAPKGAGWKDYYGIRNRLYIAARYYNRLTAFAITAKKAWDGARECVAFAKEKEWEKVRFTANLYRDAILDGMRGRLGKNRRYLPG